MRENVVSLIRETFPDDPHTAVAIAKCESGLNPKAHNGRNANGTTDGGLFQLNSIHYQRMEKLGLEPYDVRDNVRFARMLYDESGWTPWVCYRKVAQI